jgi:hypothetical protein
MVSGCAKLNKNYHSPLSTQHSDLLAWNRDNVSVWSNISIHELLHSIPYNTIFLNLLRFGLVYVGETKGKPHKRICGHQLGIISNLNYIVFQHFNSSDDHSMLSMRVRIID